MKDNCTVKKVKALMDKMNDNCTFKKVEALMDNCVDWDAILEEEKKIIALRKQVLAFVKEEGYFIKLFGWTKMDVRRIKNWIRSGSNYAMLRSIVKEKSSMYRQQKLALTVQELEKSVDFYREIIQDKSDMLGELDSDLMIQRKHAKRLQKEIERLGEQHSVQLAAIRDRELKFKQLGQGVDIQALGPEEREKILVQLARAVKPLILRDVGDQVDTQMEEAGFCCPISGEPFKDPVVCDSGHTYERCKIEAWFAEGNLTCPKTRQPISRNLSTNWALKKALEHEKTELSTKAEANAWVEFVKKARDPV